MVKIFAVIIIIISGGLFGNSLCKAEKDKLKLREEFCGLIYYIHRNIQRSSNTLDKIFSEYFEKGESKKLEEMFKAEKGLYGEKIINISKQLCSEYVCLELSHFAKTLGTLDRDAQIKTSEESAEILRKYISEKRSEYANKKKVYLALSVLAAAVFAILLV